jgi:peptidoglycan/LPS O-acetylase OafA/YrhL
MRLQALDGVRGIIALMIALFHVHIAHSLFFSPWLREIYPVIDVFFILSGFVIAMVYGARIGDGLDLANFMTRRIGRAWPLHFVTLGFLVAVELTRAGLFAADQMHGGPLPFSEGRLADTILPNVFFIQAWGWDNKLSWNYPSWTVSTEVAAYLLMGLMCVALRERSSRLICAGVLTIASAVIYYVQTDGWTELRHMSVARCTMGFFAGYLLFHARQKWPLTGRALLSVLETGALISAGALMTARGWPYLGAVLVFAAGIYVFASDGGLWSSLLKHPALQWIGERSYSIYLCHVPVIWVMDAVCRGVRKFTPVDTLEPKHEILLSLGPQWATDLLALSYLGAVVGVSALMYRWVEAPSRDVANKLAKDWFGQQKAHDEFWTGAYYRGLGFGRRRGNSG